MRISTTILALAIGGTLAAACDNKPAAPAADAPASTTPAETIAEAPKADPEAVARDEKRKADAKAIKDALAALKASGAKYPIFGDNISTELTPALSTANLLTTVPSDPTWGGTGKDYRYVSTDGTKYAMVVHFETPQQGLPNGACLIGDGFEGTGWYAENGVQPPACPF